MRWAVVVGLAILATGCGSREGGKRAEETIAAPKVETTCADGINCANSTQEPVRQCTASSNGFRSCTTFALRGERSTIQRRAGSGWLIVLRARQAPHPGHGWWRGVILSPDAKTLLGQWSGECEIQTTYLVPSDGGTPRAIFSQAQSTAVGWSGDGRARVRVATVAHDERGDVVAGIYLVDPETMSHSREQALRRAPAC